MKILSHIRGRSIVAISVVVALLIVLSAYIELQQSRSELYHVMEGEALSLIEAIDRSSQNTILATEQMERQITERLFNNAVFIARLDSLGLLTPGQLEGFAASNDIYRINIFDRGGRKVLTSYAPHSEHADIPPKHSPVEYIAPILEGRADRITIGMKEARFTDEHRFAVAVRRTAAGGGAIVLNLNAADLLAFRKSVGIGRLLQDLGDSTGVEYIALQDSEGIIAASRRVRELSSFEDDRVLRSSQTASTPVTRTTEFDNHEVFEVLRPLLVKNEPLGVLRVGVSMNEIHATEDRMIRRMVVVSLVLIALGALLMTAVVANQNYQITRKRLAAVETFTGSVLEHMQDAVITIDDTGTVTLFNKGAQELFGVAEDTVVRRSLNDLATGAAACVHQVFNAPGDGGDTTITCADGIARTVSVSFSTSRTEQTGSRTAVVRDRTEAHRLQEEINRKEKLSAMGELASGVAHEVRNPLNAIAMIGQRFEREFTPERDAEEYQTLARTLRSEALRVNGIIRQFLRFARPPAAELTDVRQEEFIGYVSTVFEGQARGKGVQFHVVGDLGGTIRVDSELMTQALLNILQNALDATGTGGSITLKCMREANGVTFIVNDTGTGIPPENIEKMFNLYFSTKKDGTGLGLAITHQIVSQHGGSISVSSTPGAGTEIRIHIGN